VNKTVFQPACESNFVINLSLHSHNHHFGSSGMQNIEAPNSSSGSEAAAADTLPLFEDAGVEEAFVWSGDAAQPERGDFAAAVM
jgi:hypothetical protein